MAGTPEASITGLIRVQPEDFQVEEVLGFEPDGQGEHLWLWLEKRSANTHWLAGQLARWAGVAPMAVGYAGMKDRHAVTGQWFSIHLPLRQAPPEPLAVEGVVERARSWHSRKLKRGSHRGNRFVITLRDIQGDLPAAQRRLADIAAGGVPNFFGSQRFGHGGGNVDQARDWLAATRPARLPPARRGLLLSAARSWLFNQVLAERVARGDWNQAVPGDCFQLDGRGSWFGPEADISADIQTRVENGLIHATGPLWGKDEPATALAVQALEQAVADAEPVLSQGLARFGLRQERRALRLLPQELAWSVDEGGRTLQLSFQLPRGAFATCVLAAFCTVHDAAAGGGPGDRLSTDD
ncbi:MAG: tRNA pseudouridine(13) synthase TruD [Xanthomonadales bacterium]|nr:tRNA pseudouridine(13) synthase TruD [Xanthomonadales bacterium]